MRREGGTEMTHQAEDNALSKTLKEVSGLGFEEPGSVGPILINKAIKIERSPVLEAEPREKIYGFTIIYIRMAFLTESLVKEARCSIQTIRFDRNKKIHRFLRPRPPAYSAFITRPCFLQNS